MSGPGTIAINGSVSGLLTGSKDIGPLTISVSQAKAVTSVIAISIGNTTVAIPTGTTAMVLNMDPANSTSGTCTLKGNSGDTGIKINPQLPLVFCPDGETSMIITSDVAISAEAVFI